MRSSGRRRSKRRGQDEDSGDSGSEDADRTWRPNIPRRSRNANPNYRVDLQGDDFLENEGSRPSRTRSRPPRSMLAVFDHVKVITVTSRINGEARVTTLPSNDEAQATPLHYRGKGRGKPDQGRRPTKTARGLASNPIVIEDDEEVQDEDDNKHDGEEEEVNAVTKGTILSWLIDMKVVNENEKVRCLDNKSGRQLGEGAIFSEGIKCDCCKEIFTVSRFPVHLGHDDAFKPYERIFVSRKNVSLIMCQVEAWNKQTMPTRLGYQHIMPPHGIRDHYDDTCMICADGGTLICCERCPSTYHPKCLLMEEVPQGEWQCPHCSCRFCNGVGVDGKPLLTCFQCQQRYHRGYCGNPEMEMHLNHFSIPFCGPSCLEIYWKLEQMIGQRQQIGKDMSWSLLRRMDEGPGPFIQDAYLRTKTNSKIVIAAKTMAQAFHSIIDRYCRIDTIKSVVYNCGSNFPRVNFNGFYTAVLEFKDEIISVASIRIHGQSTAEMPFIATSRGWRRRGMCRLLFTAIES
ncbi:hypothetical protein Droror1_Dr00027122, partial [Drosera rotundifolia]